jgi:hypothetical protein
MRRVYLYVIVILVFIGAILIFGHRTEIGFLRSWLPAHRTEGLVVSSRASQLTWQPVDEASQGFKIEMPGNPANAIAQADNEIGSTEPIRMIQVKPDNDHTYAVAWADKPPVARVNDLVPDKTIDQARDGALARTSTTLVSEIRSNPQGYPGRDVVAHNAGGGILDARFIFAGTRLYMLIATAPSASSRHEQDVIRFFNSFAVAGNTTIPETLPAATQ